MVIELEYAYEFRNHPGLLGTKQNLWGKRNAVAVL